MSTHIIYRRNFSGECEWVKNVEKVYDRNCVNSHTTKDLWPGASPA